ncbi:hypothetical protein C8R47DRAFT_1153930 [Mycena vitilis]|nr:hypothetical protein C8R47DRAFT_1153930 [Mycena vitilis]
MAVLYSFIKLQVLWLASSCTQPAEASFIQPQARLHQSPHSQVSQSPSIQQHKPSLARITSLLVKSLQAVHTQNHCLLAQPRRRIDWIDEAFRVLVIGMSLSALRPLFLMVTATQLRSLFYQPQQIEHIT